MLKIEDLIPSYKIYIECSSDTCKKEILGDNSDLLSGLCILVSELKKRGASTELIEHSVKIGLMSRKELEEDLKKNIKDMIDNLF